MDKESFQQKVGIDQAGITRGSRFLPFLLLIIVVVAFVAHAIKLPTPDLQLVSLT